MYNYKKIIKLIITIFSVIIFYMLIIPCISGCSINTIIEELYMDKENSLELPEIEIDEKEISEIGKGDMEIKKSYDIEDEISLIDDSVRDPFKPFYIKDAEEEEKNVLELKKIYTKDGIKYVELSVNGYLYLLKEGDPFSGIYLVKVINPTSVVLLKGDEILTILINEVKYD